MRRRGGFNHQNGFCAGGPRRGCGHGWRVGILILIIMMIGISMHNRSEVSFASGGPMRMSAAGAQSYMNGLTVAGGQSLQGDVVVYGGDAEVQSRGAIDGDLVVYSGDATVEGGAEVSGDLTVWAGDVQVDGTVGGNVSALAGDITLGEGAYVGGDLSSLSGDIERGESATVAGNVVRGPKLGLTKGLFGSAASVVPAPPGAPAAPAAPHVVGYTGPSLFGRLFGMVGRMFLAFFLTVLVTLVTVVVYTLRPNTIERVQKEMTVNMPRSFAVGITINVALWLMIMLLGITVCLTPVAVVPALTLIALGAVGWTTAGRTLGQRLSGSMRSFDDRKPVLEVALGSFVLAGVMALAAAILGGGFNFLVGLAALVVAAPGVGAFAEPWVERYRNRKSQDYSTPGSAPGTPPTQPAPPAAPAGPAVDRVEIVPVVAAPVTPPVAAPAEPEVDLTAVEAPAVGLSVDGQTMLTLPTIADTDATDTTRAVAESSAVAAPDATLTIVPEAPAPVAGEGFDFTLPEPSAGSAGDAGMTVQDLVLASDDEMMAAAADAAAREEMARQTGEEPPAGDDFTRITGIGRSADRKLRSAGILTYAQLAAAPVEMVAAVVGVRVEEVIEDEIQKQANALAARAQG